MGKNSSKTKTSDKAKDQRSKLPKAVRRFLNRFRRKSRKQEIKNEEETTGQDAMHPDSTWHSSPRSEEEPISIQVSQGGLASIAPFRIEDCTLDSFEPIKVLGKGNFAEVSLVREKISNKIYAMKTITRHRHFDEDYQAELKALELTRGRKFLIGLVTHFETVDMAFLVTDLVHGHDLLYYLEQVERMSEDCARLYSAETAIALHFLHQHGIIHRDVKLENIILNFEGHIKLVDYGGCKFNILGSTRRHMGTFVYMAPEIITGKQYNHAIDFWALGVVLYELLTGNNPFIAPEDCENEKTYVTQAILHKFIEIPRYLSYRAGSILRGFLKRNENERLGSCPHFGYANIQLHPFYYNSFSFSDLERNMVEIPFKPPSFKI